MYFSNHRDEKECKILILKCVHKDQILCKCHNIKILLSPISSIIRFIVEQTDCKHFVFTEPKVTNCKCKKIFAISYILVPEKYFRKVCNTYTLRKFDLVCGITMYHFKGLL